MLTHAHIVLTSLASAVSPTAAPSDCVDFGKFLYFIIGVLPCAILWDKTANFILGWIIHLNRKIWRDTIKCINQSTLPETEKVKKRNHLEISFIEALQDCRSKVKSFIYSVYIPSVIFCIMLGIGEILMNVTASIGYWNIFLIFPLAALLFYFIYLSWKVKQTMKTICHDLSTYCRMYEADGEPHTQMNQASIEEIRQLIFKHEV